jgi:stringent starvation protein B
MSDENKGKVIHVAFGAPKNEVVEAPRDPASELSIQKSKVFEELVDKGIVMVTLDTRVDGVSVPDQFRGSPQLHLNFSYDYQIPDFEFDDYGVRASLSFGGRNHFCDIPWEAVYMLRPEEQEEGMVFPASLPKEIRQMLPPEVLRELEEEDEE